MPETDPAVYRALQTLGVAHRAGRTAVGTRAVQEAGATGELQAVLVAGDASENAVARIAGVLRDGPPVFRCGSRASLGRAVGRSRVAVIGLTEADLAEKITAPFDRMPPASGNGGGGPEVEDAPHDES